MSKALRASGRDIVYSLSNSAPFDHAADWAEWANCWRTTGDINDSWGSVSRIGFSEDKWQKFGGPGHWNDPDMLVVGKVGWGNPHPSKLTPNEQYTHISLWCLLSAPLLIGCDMAQLDDFTLGLLTNDEVLAVDQDPMGTQARQISKNGFAQVWAKPLEDGSMAVGLFNLGEWETPVTVNWSDLKIDGERSVRDLWRQQDLDKANEKFEAKVPRHGVVLVKLSK
jgi:alpha-galactosidase